jgi:hypothetical protein
MAKPRKDHRRILLKNVEKDAEGPGKLGSLGEKAKK